MGSILQALDEHRERDGENARLTNVATSANLPYDRLTAYLDELARAGLVTRDRTPRLTDRGREFLRAYRQLSDVLERFGLG